MGHLTGKTTYLIGNIQNTPLSDHGMGWRDEITPIIEKRFDVTVINPCKTTLLGVGECNVEKDQKYFHNLIKEKQYTKVKDEFWKVIKKDLRSVEKADFMIFNHDPLLPTVGSIHELVNAYNQKKPVLVKCNEELLDRLNPWLLTLIRHNWLFTTWEEMWKYLDEIHQGKLDTSWWY
jgi:hypothetical protein